MAPLHPAPAGGPLFPRRSVALVQVLRLFGRRPQAARLAVALWLHGWALDRLFFWQLLAAMSVLVGVELVIGWFIMRALEELSGRELAVAEDLRGSSPSGGERWGEGERDRAGVI